MSNNEETKPATVEELILTQFRLMRNDIKTLDTKMQEEFRDMKIRMNNLESGMVLVDKRMAHHSEVISGIHVQMDRMNERLRLIELRLEIVEVA